MSGFGALSSALLSPTSSDKPGRDPLTIGPVTFNSCELWTDLPIGGFEADLVENKRIGGGKHVADMGLNETPVTVSAELWQPNIDTRVAQLTALILSRQEVPLRWRTHRYYCRVKKFQPTFHHANRAGYELELVITRADNGAVAPATPASVDSQITNLASNAAGQAQSIATVDPTGSSSLLQSVNTALAAVSAAGPIAQLSAPSLSSLIQSVYASVTAATEYQALLKETDSQYVAASQLITSLTLISQFAQNGQNVKTVRVQGASLYEIAAMYFDDPTVAFQLQSANGKISPYTSRSAYTDIGLPPLQSTTA